MAGSAQSNLSDIEAVDSDGEKQANLDGCGHASGVPGRWIFLKNGSLESERLREPGRSMMRKHASFILAIQ